MFKVSFDVVKPCKIGSNFCKHSKVHEKPRLLLPYPRTCTSAMSLVLVHAWASLLTFPCIPTDPDLALLIWLPSLTSGLSHHNRLPSWSLDYLADPGHCPQTYSVLLLMALWDCTPCWWDHGPNPSLQLLALLLQSSHSCSFLTEGCGGGRSKIKATLFLGNT